MKAVVKPFDKFSVPRVAQLTQRSNQFNLRTIRYTENDITNISSNNDHHTLSLSLEDKFGNYGLIAVIILKDTGDKTLFIDTWIMSCRVLKRGMENFTLNKIAELAIEKGFEKIVGEYIPTVKNGLVKNHYPGLGFTQKENTWEIALAQYIPKEHFINEHVTIAT